MTDAGKIPNNSNRVCQILKTEKPVIQGPLFWLTDAKLVAAVSEAGGLGVLGPHAGQNSLPKDDAERAERMRAEIKKVKELTSKPFGINIIVTDKKPDVQLELMLNVVYEEKVPVAVVVYNSPNVAEDVIKELKSHGVKLYIVKLLLLLRLLKKQKKPVLILLSQQEWTKEGISQEVI